MVIDIFKKHPLATITLAGASAIPLMAVSPLGIAPSMVGAVVALGGSMASLNEWATKIEKKGYTVKNIKKKHGVHYINLAKKSEKKLKKVI